MEPKQSSPRRSPELSAPVPTPEAWNGNGFENVPAEVSHEREPIPVASSGENELPMPTIPAPSTPQGDVAASSSMPTATSDNPLTASDDDVIEKEWVDKAKKIIGNTKGDPYRREYEVGRLQADYIEKRYGKKLGEAS